MRHHNAKLRKLASGRGVRLERTPIPDRWFLIYEKTGGMATTERGKTAFSVKEAKAFLYSARQRGDAFKPDSGGPLL